MEEEKHKTGERQEDRDGKDAFLLHNRSFGISKDMGGVEKNIM